MKFPLKGADMTIEAEARPRAAAPWRLAAMAMRAAGVMRAALLHRGAADELGGLPDRYLSDIGVDRLPISDAVKADLARTCLLDSGWPRRSGRR